MDMNTIYDWYTNQTPLAVTIITTTCTCCFTTVIDFITEYPTGINLQCRGTELFIANTAQCDAEGIRAHEIQITPLT